MKLTWLLYISHCILQLTALYSLLLRVYHSFQQLIALYSWWLCNIWLLCTAGYFVHITAFNSWLLCTANGFVTVDCTIQLAALCILLLCTASCFVQLGALYRCWLCKRDQVTVFFLFRRVHIYIQNSEDLTLLVLAGLFGSFQNSLKSNMDYRMLSERMWSIYASMYKWTTLEFTEKYQGSHKASHVMVTHPFGDPNWPC